MQNTDDAFLAHAIALAKKGTGFVSPNPLVGAVIVDNNRIVAEGWHARYGDRHAEVMALNAYQGTPDQHTTMYVTLEPCNHYGKQPPCTDAIIRSGVRNLVVGMRDPNPKVKGGGIDRLVAAGIHVRVYEGSLLRELRWLYRMWSHAVINGTPYLIVKIAQSIDGVMAPKENQTEQLTGNGAQKIVHTLRSEVDAVLVGMSTVRTDNPRLSVRFASGRDPVRIVVTQHAELPPESYLAKTRHELQTHLVTINTDVPSAHDDFASTMRSLYTNYGITSVLSESGPHFTSWLLRNHMVQELHVHVAPILCGRGRRAVFGRTHWKLYETQTVGPDVLITYLPLYSS